MIEFLRSHLWYHHRVKRKYSNNSLPFSGIAEIKRLLRSTARRASTRACQYSWKSKSSQLHCGCGRLRIKCFPFLSCNANASNVEPRVDLCDSYRLLSTFTIITKIINTWVLLREAQWEEATNYKELLTVRATIRLTMKLIIYNRAIWFCANNVLSCCLFILNWKHSGNSYILELFIYA